MRKIITVVGARPQFIKAAALSRVIHEIGSVNNFEEILVHTGQHFDANMSEVFFKEMRIPHPAYHLGIGGTSHGRMTGQMLEKLEELYLQLKPDAVLVYGDTNSTLAGALAASKLDIPVAHIEAGLRSYWKRMPEEQNRVLTDHLSTWLFCPTHTSVENLKKEGIEEGVYRVGDVMYDVNLFYREVIAEEENQGKKRPEGVKLSDSPFALMTVHRAENTDDVHRLRGILEGVGAIPMPVVWPVHPRTSKILQERGISLPSNILSISPVGYLDMLALENRAQLILTDSGGVQKEAYFAGKPCITLRDQSEWVETVEDGWNILAGTNPERILQAYHQSITTHHRPRIPHYGDGHSAQKIVKILLTQIPHP